MHLRTFVGDNQRALKLTSVFRVDSEISLQRHVAFDAWRNINKRATRPNRSIERRELVVARRNNRTKILLNEIWIFAKRGIHIAEKNAKFFEIFAVAVKHNFAFVLRSDAGQIFALCFRNAQLFVGVAHLLWQIFPLVNLRSGWLQVVVDVLKIDVGHVDREPIEHRFAFESLQRAQTHFAHPFGLAFPPRDLLNDARV